MCPILKKRYATKLQVRIDLKIPLKVYKYSDLSSDLVLICFLKLSQLYWISSDLIFQSTQEKNRISSEMNELRDHLDIKDRKISVLQRKVRTSTLNYVPEVETFLQDWESGGSSEGER